jgi:hypothetical protein
MTDTNATESTPIVEIAGYRDPDGDVTLRVFVNGVETTPVVDIVDPGKSGPCKLSEWREHLLPLENSTGSPQWRKAVVEFHYDAEDCGHTTEDRTTATNPQPGVSDLTRLDPGLWIGSGELADKPVTVEQVAANYTTRAGWALFAVLAHHSRTAFGHRMFGLRDPYRLVPITGTYPAAAEAVAGYAQLTSPGARIEELVVVLRDLLSDLRHLADARGIALAAPIDDQSPELARAIHTLIADPAWVQGAAEDATAPNVVFPEFHEINHSAYARYLEEVTVELTAR